MFVHGVISSRARLPSGSSLIIAIPSTD
jgi:hypothetical protein